MSRLRIGALGAAGILVGLAFSGVSQSEDAAPRLTSYIEFGDAIRTPAGSFMPVTPLGQLVVRVAHLGPRVGDRIARGRPVECKTVGFVIDKLLLGSEGGINKAAVVTEGDEEPRAGRRDNGLLEPFRLGAWEWVEKVYSIEDLRAGIADPAGVGFSVRGDKPSPGCSVVPSVLFYPNGVQGGSPPIPVPLVTGLGKP